MTMTDDETDHYSHLQVLLWLLAPLFGQELTVVLYNRHHQVAKSSEIVWVRLNTENIEM